MSEYLAVFRSFDGRISRGQFWPGVIGLAIAFFAIGFVLISLAGIYLRAVAPQDTTEVIATMRRWTWATLLVNIAFAYPILALTVKRRHDRNKSGVDVVVYYCLLLLLTLAQAFGWGFVDTDLGNGTVIPMPGMLLKIVSTICGLLGIYLFVVLGFLRGTRGPNNYGPDPIGSDI